MGEGGTCTSLAVAPGGMDSGRLMVEPVAPARPVEAADEALSSLRAAGLGFAIASFAVAGCT
jgi:hypothetical protein